MRKNDLTEIKQLDLKALVAKILAAKKELTDLVLDKNTNKLKDVKVVSKKKKDIAKMLTIANQKKVLAEVEKIETEVKKKSKKEENSK